MDSSLSFKPGRAEVNDFIGDFVSVGAAHGNPIRRRRRKTRRNQIMRRRRSLKRRKRKIKRRRTREVEEVDAICVHVGGEEVEKQGEETEGVARDKHALSFGMEIRAV